MNTIIDSLYKYKTLTDNEFLHLLNAENSLYLRKKAVMRQNEYYGNNIYIRGLIEISNYCKNNCYYCGIRRDNLKLSRYRLTLNDIMTCANEGYKLGFRTFVLQGGEDLFYSDNDICEIIYSLKNSYPDCAVTLSIGEKPKDTYRNYKKAGCDRYLLRHETADNEHYQKLHPYSMSLDVRKQCLWNLKELGFQVGSGFMVGSPYQTNNDIVEDLRFLQKLEPDMIGIGPFLPHYETPFKDMAQGSYTKTLKLISILRLMFPYALLPSTTALATISPKGRSEGILAGANVVMPNLSPTDVRKLYSLYNNKAILGNEAAEAKDKLCEEMTCIGYNVVTDIGNVKKTGG